MMKMDYYEFLKFLKKYFPVAETKLISKPIEIRGEYFVKINSMEHKSDVGGVIKVRNKYDIENAFKKLKKISNPPFILQKKVNGNEFIVGLKKDRSFGCVIMFGGGGILTEIYKDVSFRKCPIKKRDAVEMIDDTKIGKLFNGFRSKKLNKEEMVNLLVKLSKMYQLIEFKSVDLNPIIVNEKSAFIVDARLDQ